MRINKDQFSADKFKDLKFAYKRGRGHFPHFLLNRLRWYCYPHLHYVSRFPSHLDIEISSLCNMQCPMCFTTLKHFREDTDKGLMNFPLFRRIIDEAVSQRLYSIRISHRGEALMHPEVIRFIKYAKDSGVKEVSSLSNILVLTPSLFEDAVKAGLDWLTISFDGLRETYESIRKPARFEEAYNKIKEYKKIKARLASHKPVIKIQSIWSAVKDNFDEFIEMFKPYVDAIAFNPLIDYLHNDDPAGIEYWEGFDCPVPYQRLTVLFNGLVPYCHNDEFATCIIADANKDTIYNIWHSKQMSEVRAAHKKHQGVKLLSACRHCFLPRRAESVVERAGAKKLMVEKYTKRSEEIGA